MAIKDGNGVPTPPAPPMVTLTIQWVGPGHPVQVNGPINDKMLCYALLELARDAIREYNDALAQKSRLVQPVAITPPSHLKLVRE